MRLTFLGATGTVTGSRYLLEHGGRRVLVDCGCSRASSSCGCATGTLSRSRPRHRCGRADPRAPRPQRLPAAAGAAGLPRPGALHAATRDLCGCCCRIRGGCSEEEAEYANRHGYLEAPAGAAALHRGADARHALERFVAEPLRAGLRADPGRARGAAPRRASARCGQRARRVGRRSLLFSGDLGAQRRPADAAARAARGRATGWSSNRPTATACTRRRSAGDDRRRGQPDAARGGIVVDPGVRGRPGADAAVLPAPPEGAAPHPRPAGLPNSPMAADATRIYAEHRDEHRLTPSRMPRACARPRTS